MQCNQCPFVEMRIIGNDGKVITFKCPKCEQTKTVVIDELSTEEE